MVEKSSSVIDRYQSVRGLTTAILRQQILDHTLKPNERLRQEDLAARLGVSRMPVRDALRSLEAEGLVTITRHGAVVDDMSPEAIKESYTIRAALESLSARLGVERITPETLSALAAILEEMRHLQQADDHVGLLEKMSQFLDTLYEASGMPRLCGMIRTLRANCERYRRAYIAVPGRTGRAVELHTQMLSACQRRDTEEMERLVRSGLMESATVLLRYLGGDGWKPSG